MKVVIIEAKVSGFVVRFAEGPRSGYLASQDIGTPHQKVLIWPDRVGAEAWVAWNGHTEISKEHA